MSQRQINYGMITGLVFRLSNVAGRKKSSKPKWLECIELIEDREGYRKETFFQDKIGKKEVTRRLRKVVGNPVKFRLIVLSATRD